MQISNKAKLRQAMLDLCSIADGFDKSWSFSAKGKEERFLLYFDSPKRAQELENIAISYGFQADWLIEWRAAVNDADALGISSTASLDSLRLYTQFWDAQVRRINQNILSPFPIYFGWKKPSDLSIRLDKYMSMPMAPAERYLPKIQKLSDDLGFSKERMHELARCLTPEQIIYTETESSLRTSWLATVRKANVPDILIENWLRSGKNTKDIQEVVNHASEFPLLHLAAGHDSNKGHFNSIYFEASEQTVAAMISN